MIPSQGLPEPVDGAPAPGTDPAIDIDPAVDTAVDTAVFAWEWARVLVGTSYVAADRTVIAARLRELTLDLVAALRARPFSPHPGIAVGEAVVGAGFVSPDALAGTIDLLGRLPGEFDLGPEPDEGWSVRLNRLIAKLAQGFVRAVRDRTLEQQEAIRSSALLAWQRARDDQRNGALRDPLTGLPNRAGFVERLVQLIRDSPDGLVSACLLVVDGFSAIDRGLGREVGDQVVSVVADRLSERFTGPDELVARVGRNEFVVAAVHEVPTRRSGDSVAARVAAAQQVVRTPVQVDGRPFSLTASTGLVTRPAVQSDAQGVLRDADLAASWAHSRGTGTVAVFDRAKAERQGEEVALAAELPTALVDGSVTPHYQPIVSLVTGRIEAVEALARWPHAEHGLLLPDRFLDLAERAGLMGELGRTMLRQACTQGRAWQLDLRRAPVISVNVAAAQLTDRQTVADVAGVLEATELAPSLLQLEITEHAALADAGTLRVIRDLAAYGVRLTLDDFGTGQAHLARLPELPEQGVTGLKVPADFLTRLEAPARGPVWAVRGSTHRRDTARLRVLAAVVDLAHSLQLQVTIEGVETPVQDALVRDLGIDFAQGSHYGRAMAAATIEPQLRERR